MITYKFCKDAEQYFKKVEVIEDTPLPKETKRFNLRLSNGDIDFIKFFSEKHEVSRTHTIDNIIQSIICDFLSSLEVEEYILLIKIADMLNGVDTTRNMEDSWISNLYPSQIPHNNIHHDLYNQSEMNELKDRSERYKKMFTAIVDSKLIKDFNDQQKGEEVNETEK